MTKNEISPILKYNFEPSGTTLKDITRNGNVGTIGSSVQVINDDPVMGTCLEFTGDGNSYISFPNLPGTGISDLSNGITMTAWINATSVDEHPVLLNFGNSTNNISFQIGSGIPYSQIVEGSQVQSLSCSQVIDTGKWYHLAITINSSGNGVVYINGAIINQTTINLLPPVNMATTTNWIGKGSWGNTGTAAPPFKGMMAWMAIYNGALDQGAIQEDMMEGQIRQYSTFRQSFPLNFKLQSEDRGSEVPILYIEDEGDGENLQLSVINNSEKSITLIKPTGAAPDFHFQLHFRPGTLSSNFLSKTPTLLNAADWTVSLAKGSAGTDLLNFLYSGTEPISAGQEVVITIESVNASALGGSRNTNVEFQYANVQVGPTADVVQGFQMQNLSVVNHSGEKDISLRADIVGGARILNYAKPSDPELGLSDPPQSELLFRIVNTGATLPLRTPSSAYGATEFVLNVDVQTDEEFMEWALMGANDHKHLILEVPVLGVVKSATSTSVTLQEPLASPIAGNAQLNIIPATGPEILITVASEGAAVSSSQIPIVKTSDTISTGASVNLSSNLAKWKVVSQSSNGTPLTWTIQNQSLTEWKENTSLEFLLTGIECSLPAGSSVITIQYKNFPGHWEGQFDLKVEKSPVVYRNNQMGINTGVPNASLHIVEEQGEIPLKVEERITTAAPTSFPTHDVKQDVRMMRLHDVGQNTYMDEIMGGDFSNSQGEITSYVQAWQYEDSSYSWNFLINATDVTAEFPNLPGRAAYHYNYAYVRVPGSTDINIYTLDFQVNSPVLGTIKSVGFGQDAFVGINQGFLFAQNIASGVNNILVYDINASATDPTLVQTLELKNLSSYALFQGGYAYLIYDSKFSIQAIQLDGSLTEIGSVAISSVGEITVFENLAFVCPLIGNSITIIDISNPVSPTIQKLTLGSEEASAGPSLTVQLFANILIAGYLGQLLIYDLTVLSTPKLIHTESLTSDFSGTNSSNFGISAVGTVGKYLYVSGLTDNTGDGQTYLYDKEKILNWFFGGRGTSITSNQISIGSVPSNASMNLPYPSVGGQNGLVIGEAYKSKMAALSIHVDSGSGVNPLAINDSNGNSVLNVNVPEGQGQSFRMGIGTNNPQAPLHVASTSPVKTPDNFGFLNDKGYSVGTTLPVTIGDYAGTQTPPTGIYAEGYVQAEQFFAISDIRIKEAIKTSDGTEDLRALLKIEIADYRYIDVVGKGNQGKKGLIAQQVKAVFPQAVNAANSDFVPDIYAMSDQLDWVSSIQQLRVKLEKPHNVNKGDILRLIADQGQKEKEVIDVIDEKTFVVGEWSESTEQLFVFGKQVDDFHTVDYDQVAMLGVSAIQALHQKVEDLKKENEALNQRLDTELEDLKAQFEAFKSSMKIQHQN